MTTKTITTTIKKCKGCPHLDHTGGFTKGGAKPCCDHPETVKAKGYNCFKRIIPYRRKFFDMDSDGSYLEIRRIPDWCPLL